MAEDCCCICYCEHTLRQHSGAEDARCCRREDCYCSEFERYQEDDADPCPKHQLGCVAHIDGWVHCGDIDASDHVILCASCFK